MVRGCVMRIGVQEQVRPKTAREQDAVGLDPV